MNRDEWISVRLSGSDRKELERLAAEEERSVSGMVRVAIKLLLESRKAAA